jgi:hypothetical protein
MAGGGGGGGGYSKPSASLEKMLEDARARERQRLEGEVGVLLQKVLSAYDDRDRELTKMRLGELQAALGERIDVDRILFGGSVAKHTEVDGLSDVDALVFLNRDDLRGSSATQVKDAMLLAIKESLPVADVADFKVGRMAVTVRYHDGMEIQLVPAVKTGTTVAVPAAKGDGWTETEPEAFRRELTRSNDRLGGRLVPAIKLMKSIVSGFPEQKRISGYHVEALAVQGARGYTGEKTTRGVLLHLLASGSRNVLMPIPDVTGQSRAVDAYLGPANSLERRNVALALDGMRRKLNAATTVAEWKSTLEA